ncbi:hypothetical protein M3201_20825 [Paenibacillus motobuensis]|uniref:hypothetical protein n=1 Tax=Paenibacillus TaxID=44249 RepID=UPI00203D0238|nr:MULTISPECIES: hypothetical protein [Paenibacillus]MCM3042114.1 hypothetical protein [Paenibacillus lutimineralis]MCM3649218.1 hypothetical protein [Paenibacillus motobuensis]
MGQIASGKTSRLFNKLSLPLLGLIVVFIVLSTTASSYILIQVQNNHTLKMAEQSMEFVHRNVWYQFDTMKNVSAFVRSNQFIDNLIDRQYKDDYELLPFTFFCFRIENWNDTPGNHLLKYSWGMTLTQDDLLNLNVGVSDRVEYLPPVRCLSSESGLRRRIASRLMLSGLCWMNWLQKGIRLQEILRGNYC